LVGRGPLLTETKVVAFDATCMDATPLGSTLRDQPRWLGPPCLFTMRPLVAAWSPRRDERSALGLGPSLPDGSDEDEATAAGRQDHQTGDHEQQIVVPPVRLVAPEPDVPHKQLLLDGAQHDP
jgi:hypothetical protein